jgi:hypothetical protein
MKRFILVTLAACVIALLLVPCSWAKTKTPARKQVKPKLTALVCSFDARGFSGSGVETEPSIFAIGGLVAGKGWINSEQAKGLMHKGNKLSLYDPNTASFLGTLVLTSEDWSDGYSWGGISPASFFVRAKIPSAKKIAYKKTNKAGLAVWSPQGLTPRWIIGKTINIKSKTYRRIIENWLNAKGFPEDALKSVVIEQIIQADINRDGRKETFLSFHGSDVSDGSYEPSSKRAFSYLIMCYRPSRSNTIRTVAVDDNTPVHFVNAFCDLDKDGWAEVITWCDTGEAGGQNLHHWIGDHFETFRGWIIGV